LIYVLFREDNPNEKLRDVLWRHVAKRAHGLVRQQ